jgi:hypothetical protein
VRLTHDKDFDVITSVVIKLATAALLYLSTVKIGFLLVCPPDNVTLLWLRSRRRKFCAPNLRIVDVLTHFFPLLGTQRPVD